MTKDEDAGSGGSEEQGRDLRYVNKKDALKERARQMRQAAYQRAKAHSKAQRLERENSPEGIERKARLKERRRAHYQKAKDAHKTRVDELRAKDRAQAEREEAEATALRDEELRASLVTADKLPPPRPKLRLVKESDSR